MLGSGWDLGGIGDERRTVFSRCLLLGVDAVAAES